MDIRSLIGVMVGAIFYGVYCVIFALYLKIQSKRKYDSKNILFYALTANFILCTAFLAAEMALVLLELELEEMVANSPVWIPVNNLQLSVDVLYLCIDFISQAILIYRCWVMWRQPLIVVVPTILTLACSGTLLATLVALINSPGYNQSEGASPPEWYYPAVVASFCLSLAANTVATSLIVLKILMVYRGLQTLKNRAGFVGSGPRDHYPVISVLVESGLVTFVAQLVQTVLFNKDNLVFPVVSCAVVMLLGISPTIVLVRVVMGASYDLVTTDTPASNPIRFAGLDSNDTHTLERSKTDQN